jgi:poly(3-hydroxyalkanoate) synthetase
VPVLAVSAASDHQDPTWACRKLFEQFGSEHKQFICLGREQGFSDNFGHVEMLVSKSAQTQVWPLVERWLKDQQTPLLTRGSNLAAAV